MAHLKPRLLQWLVCLAAMIFVFTGCAASQGTRPGEMVNYRENSAATYRIDIALEGGTGHGSGTVISAEGHILTVNHVVEHPGSKLSIMLSENGGPPQTLVATVICTDVINDLAVVKVDRRFLNPATLEDIGNVHPGDEVYDVGHPFDYGEMVARGHIMKMHYSEPEEGMEQVPWNERVYVRDMILANFLAGPGTSGSGVFLSSSGKLVGVMRLLIGRGGVRSGMIVRAFVSVEQVKLFLQMNRVPYVKSDGTVMTYPPPPKPLTLPPPLKPKAKATAKPAAKPAPVKEAPHR